MGIANKNFIKKQKKNDVFLEEIKEDFFVDERRASQSQSQSQTIPKKKKSPEIGAIAETKRERGTLEATPPKGGGDSEYTDSQKKIIEIHRKDMNFSKVGRCSELTRGKRAQYPGPQ